MENLKYPIGQYEAQPFSSTQLEKWLLDIEVLPAQLEYAISNLDEAQLQTPYRPDGWTVHQLVHHVADSHMNAYIRFKLGLTEDNPTIKPYDEKAWALMADTKNLPINISTTILFAVHKRWMEVLKNISAEEWNRTVVHPEHQKQMTLWYLLGMYAWHGRHHVAHITSLRDRENW
jgi:hypothetical protein